MLNAYSQTPVDAMITPQAKQSQVRNTISNIIRWPVVYSQAHYL